VLVGSFSAWLREGRQKLERQKFEPGLKVDGSGAGEDEDLQKGGGRTISSVGGTFDGHREENRGYMS